MKLQFISTFIRQLQHRSAVLIVRGAVAGYPIIKQSRQILPRYKRKIKQVTAGSAYLGLKCSPVYREQPSLMQTVQCQPDGLQHSRLTGIVPAGQDCKRTQLQPRLLKFFKSYQSD